VEQDMTITNAGPSPTVTEPRYVASQLVSDVQITDLVAITERVWNLLREAKYKPELTCGSYGQGQPRYRWLLSQDKRLSGPYAVLGRYYLQAQCWRPDTFSGNWDWGKGGKAYLSEHMTDSEIVQLAFGLMKAYEEHEAREGFTYRGKRIYGPHMDVEMLVTVADHLDVR
jgi:hypothetical protein